MLSSQEEAEWFGAETKPVITSWRESKNPYGMSEADASVKLEERNFAGKLQEFDDEGNQVFLDAEYEDAETFDVEMPKSVKMGFGFGAGLALFQVAVIAGAVTLGMITSKR